MSQTRFVKDVKRLPAPTVTCARHVSARTREKGVPFTSFTFSDETAEISHSDFAEQGSRFGLSKRKSG